MTAGGTINLRSRKMKKILFFGVAVFVAQSSYATVDMYAINVPAEARPAAPNMLMMKLKAEKKDKGYIERISLKYNYLSNIEKRVMFAGKGSAENTDIVSSPSDIKTDSNLKHVPENAKNATIGFAAVGSYNQDSGWTGMTEVFKSSLGVCQFSHFDLIASKGGYSLSETDSLDINGNHGYMEVEGKVNSGFSYNLTWFHELNMYKLSCINKDFSKEFTDKVVELARVIDKD